MGFFKDLFGRREPCSLCRIGAQEWSSDRHASADWKLHGHGLSVSLFICVPCRDSLMQSGARHQHPALVLAQMVNQGWALNPSIDQFLQHKAWRRIWMQALERLERPIPDEFAARSAMKEVWNEMLSEMTPSPARPQAESQRPRAGSGTDDDDVSAELHKLATEYGLPLERVQVKYRSYLMTLSATGSSGWNADIDELGVGEGAFTDVDAFLALTDVEMAALNRTRLALHMESPSRDSPAPAGSDAPTPFDDPRWDESTPDVIPIPFTDGMAVEATSFPREINSEADKRQFVQAATGAATLLTILIAEHVLRAEYEPAFPASPSELATIAPNLREAAITAVMNTAGGRMNSFDTHGLYLAGKSLMARWWSEWSASGPPLEGLQKQFPAEP